MTSIAWPDADSVPSVPCKGERTTVLVVGVHDGDTFTALLPFGGAFLKINVRLLGVDAPEIKVREAARKGTPIAALEEQAGAAVRDALLPLLDKREVVIQIKSWDKFGSRLLAECWLPDGQSLSAYLLERGFARAYKGDAKQPWTEAELRRILTT
jgi:endonuclease YncB( thermonuclease family)